MGKADWRILAYLRNINAKSLEKIKVTEDREDLIDEVMKLRDQKRAELVYKHVLEREADDDESN
jgi:hypothetical protein